MKRVGAISGISLAVAMGVAIAANAQLPNGSPPATVSDTACFATTPAEQRALNAAKNEARQLAERVNGGLNVYRAEPAMHGAVVDAPCEVVGSGVWRFTIRGGDPVAVSTLAQYTILSVVTVDSATGSDRSIRLDYNGPIEAYTGPSPVIARPITQPQAAEPTPMLEAQSPNASESRCTATTPAEQIALNAAKNAARQAAEQANGGLRLYRAEPAMHGAVVDAPCQVVSPRGWRFTFRGGDPVAVSTLETYTILSVVTVTGVGRDSTVTVEYNGPIEDYNGLLPNR